MLTTAKTDEPVRRPPLTRVLYPFQRFARAEASGGILLLLCAVVALIWANSPWAASYVSLWRTTLTIGLEGHAIAKALVSWINDGLMAVFFFIVSLEIKREVLVGELASPRRAALPIAAALGGMTVPAGIYATLNLGQDGVRGWGIPMATDIAFALGVLALLGKRVPMSLKVFLTALAIVDDIGAVVVITLFYTAQVSLPSLAIGAGVLLALITANRLHIRHPLVYLVLGLGLWVALLTSGVHAAIAGVLVALTIPARTRIDAEEFLVRGRATLDAFERAGEHGAHILTNAAQQAALAELETACERVQTPMQRLERVLHPWVAFAIVPLFALANVGVALEGTLLGVVPGPVTLGIVAGLAIGKPVGIILFTWLGVRSGLLKLPEGVAWRQVYGVSVLAGIGFTMSLFVASLAFDNSALLSAAKLGILAASLIAGIAGWTLLWDATRTTTTAVTRQGGSRLGAP